MKIVQYGKWKIAVDVEKTKEYYRNYVIDENQMHRNFAEYCKSMSAEEHEFFDSFGINPECCEVTHLGVSKKKEAPCGGYYLICGKYLEHPPEVLITADEFAANNFECDIEDPRIQIGIFQFDFQCEENVFKLIPEDMPEGFICIRFWCEDLRWLLREKPEEVMYEPPKFWEIGRRIKEYLQSKREMRKYFEDCRQKFKQKFDGLGIEYSELSVGEYKKYKKLWADTYAPADADKRKIEQLCVQNAEYSTYVWHIFSYEFLNAETDDAPRLYDVADKKECMLISNGPSLGFKLKNADLLTADVLNEFDDVTVTASDFSWTYSKTHEVYCGPYYYKK